MNHISVSNLLTKAAECGDIEKIKTLTMEHNQPFDEYTLNAAISHRQVDTIKYLLENGCPSDNEAYRRAASVGSIEILGLLYDHDVKMTPRAYDSAIDNNDMKTLEYLCNTKCPLDKHVFIEAARKNNLNAINYLHSSGYYGPSTLIEEAIDRKTTTSTISHLLCKGYIVDINGCFTKALRCNNIKVITFLLSKRYRPSSDIYTEFEDKVNLNIIKTLRKYDIPWNKGLCDHVLEYDYLYDVDTLEYLKDTYFKQYDFSHMEIESEDFKHSEGAQYLHDNNIPVKWTCNEKCIFCS